MEYNFRPYETKDLDDCIKIAVEAWPILSVVAQDSLDSLMEFYLKMSLAFSNYTEVCYYKGKVIGFLFASIEVNTLGLDSSTVGRKEIRKDINIIKDEEKKKQISVVRLFWGFISGKYGNIKMKYRFLFTCILTMMKVEVICRDFDSEIVLFAVDKKYRGQGIGRSLLNNFLVKSKKHGARHIYLYTDIESNWKFYEYNGFKRFREFHDNELSLLRQEKIRSYIYVKEL
ncbi:MAG: GNAT family N-acetyltransferase [Halanaerobiales bacterium]